MRNIPNDLFFAWVEDEIAQGHDVRIRVKGESMFPFLHNGVDDVIVAPCKTEELSLLDVVLFRYRGKHVMHRIVNISEDGYTMQGDGVWASQEHCRAEDIIGKAVAVCRPKREPFSVTSSSWIWFSRIWFRMRNIRRWLLRLCRIFHI